MTNTTKNTWWGYRHANGTYQAKRYFDKRDIEDAIESPFCKEVVTAFEARDREEALSIIKERTK